MKTIKSFSCYVYILFMIGFGVVAGAESHSSVVVPGFGMASSISRIRVANGEYASKFISLDFSSIEPTELFFSKICSNPIVLWPAANLPQQNHEPDVFSLRYCTVNSLGTANYALRHICADNSSAASELNSINILKFLFGRQRGGKSIRMGMTVSELNIGHLRSLLKWKIGECELDALMARLAVEYYVFGGMQADGQQSWYAFWMEVDGLGGVDAFQLEGSVTPWAVQRVRTSVVLSAGAIPPEVLNFDNLVQKLAHNIPGPPRYGPALSPAPHIQRDTNMDLRPIETSQVEFRMEREQNIGINQIEVEGGRIQRCLFGGGIVRYNFVADSQEHYGPVTVWLGNKNCDPIFLDSLSSINAIASGFDVTQIEPSKVIESICDLLSRQRIQGGPSTGVTLSPAIYASFRKVIEKYSENIDKERILGALKPPNIVVNDTAWCATWVEVDQLGGVEQVSAKGSLKPLGVTDVVRTLVMPDGSIPQSILRHDSFVP